MVACEVLVQLNGKERLGQQLLTAIPKRKVRNYTTVYTRPAQPFQCYGPLSH